MMQLKVVKADGSIEPYLHTKVLGAISNALAAAGEPDVNTAEQLAEVVTYFLYHEKRARSVSSSEIFSMIKAVLSTTGYDFAAVTLSEYHYERRLRRARIEVVSVDIKDMTDARKLAAAADASRRSSWNKSQIVNDLVTGHNLSRQTARAIASMVEEKIFSLGLTLVPASLIKQLVLGDAAAMLRAEQQMQTA